MSDPCVDCGLPAAANDRCDDCGEEVRQSPRWRGPREPRASRAVRPKTGTCVACDSDFLVPSMGPVRTYCSPRCRAWWNNHPGVPTPPLGRCARCGELLNRLTQKYCTPRCSEIARGVRRAEPLPSRTCALPECGTEFRPYRDAQRCCSERHGKTLCNREGRASGRYAPDAWSDRRRDNYHRRRALKKGASTGRPVILAEIADRDHWKCGICRLVVNPGMQWPHAKSPSLDHVVPLSQGGAHDPANVRLAHLGCNTERGNRGGGEQLMLVG